jgi:electron transfer flavoprotein alpha subunit
MTATVFVHVETDGGLPGQDGLAIVSRVAACGLRPTAVVLGALSDDGADTLAVHGCHTALVDARRSSLPAATTCAAAIEHLAARVDDAYWLAATTTVTTEAAAVAAARIGAGLAWRITGLDVVDDELTATQISTDATSARPVAWTTSWRLGLVRANGWSPTVVDDHATIEVVPCDLIDPLAPAAVAEIVDRRPAEGDGGGLAGASVIVAGGRGLGSPDALALVRELADVLGGTAGASLPLVELGWAPRSMQVGQTGTVVAPDVYIACGISGQIQHRVGMERSRAIIAINTDPTAPIMSFSDLGVVADATVVLPALIAALAGADA